MPLSSSVPKERKLHDQFFKKAKAEGYAARSAYKLKEIQERHGLLRAGMWVLDLGCAPGSWMQVAGQIVGRPSRGRDWGNASEDGRVLGVDLQPVSIELPECCRAVVGDVFTLTAEDCLRLLGGPADVVLSDMAPNTTGDPGGDHHQSVRLCRRVLELLPMVLKPGGGLVMKVFEGLAYPDLLSETQRLFGLAKGLKPVATRQVSREMFIIAQMYQGPAAHAQRVPRDAGLAPKRPAPRPGWASGGV